MEPDPLEYGYENETEDTLSQISTALKAARILEKAQKEGIPLKEIVLVNRRGKTECVSLREQEQAQQLRKVEAKERMRQRAVRSDNNLALEISEKIRRCQELIERLGRRSSLSSKDLLAIRRNLESANNRATSLIKDMDILDNALERKKNEDPIITEFETASAQMLEAIREKQIQRISELRAYCERNQHLYSERKNRLKPYVIKAREARMKFIGEKRRLMRMEFDLHSLAAETYAKGLAEGTYSHLSSDQYSQMTQMIHQLRNMRSSAREAVERLASPIENVAVSFLHDVEYELDQINQNYLIPENQMIDQLFALVQIVGEQETPSEAEDKSGREARMVYHKKKEV